MRAPKRFSLPAGAAHRPVTCRPAAAPCMACYGRSCPLSKQRTREANSTPCWESAFLYVQPGPSSVVHPVLKHIMAPCLIYCFDYFFLSLQIVADVKKNKLDCCCD